MSTVLPKYRKVYFQPWVGLKYGKISGTKLLILGESHYGPNNAGRNYTISETLRYVNGENHRFWTNIMQAVDGRSYWDIDRKTFWEKVAFYNYIQEIVADSSGVLPEDTMYKNAVEPFREVLNQLTPTHILVCSKRLWNQLPPDGEQGPVIDSDGHTYETWKYPIVGRYSLATCIKHPSYFFTAKDWHSCILKFFLLNPI